MRIAYITYEYPPDIPQGGIGTYVTQVSQLMAKLGHEVFVFCGSLYRTIAETNNNITIVRIKTIDPLDFRKSVVSAFTTYNNISTFDVIESPEIHGNAWEIKKMYPSMPLVVRLHAPDHLIEHLKKKYVPFRKKLRFFLGSLRRGKWNLGYWRSYKYSQDADRQFALLAQHITAPSTAMKQWAIEHWKISSQKITVIPNPFFPPEVLLRHNNNLPGKTILFFGRLNVLKGLVALSFALKEILLKHPRWKATIIGNDGPSPVANLSMKKWMQRILNPVLHRVAFIDGLPYADLMEHINKCDIVVLPSLFESFSYTCAEAMAAGKAVVGSKLGGMADLLDNGNAGLLIDPYKPREIENAIEFLIMSENERKLFGGRARKRIIDYCNAEKAGNQFEELYFKIADMEMVP